MRLPGYPASAAHSATAVSAQLIDAAWARVRDQAEPGPDERAQLKRRIRAVLRARQAVMVAHYYVHPDLQDLAEDTGGMVGDSLEMARFGQQHQAQTLLVCGVRFMGETAKILSPHKRVLMPQAEATCSLDLGCPAEAFAAFCDAHPTRTVVVYANTSAAVKARADWVVTSGSAVAVVRALHARGRPILWAPDRHLGAYVQAQTGADLLAWPGSCIVHDEFKAEALRALKAQWPAARVLVHPESPPAVIALADSVGSTQAILRAAAEEGVSRFIVATDAGLLHALRRRYPGKTFMLAPTEGAGATCKSCAHCPWMAQNTLAGALAVLQSGSSGLAVPEASIPGAQRAIERLLAFTAPQVGASGAAIVPGLGAV